VDAKGKLIDKAKTTPAQVHDSQIFKDLVDESDRAVLSDSTYYSEDHEKYLFECEAEEFLMREAYRNKALSEEDEKFDEGVSKIRVRVEHVFGRMQQMGMDYFQRIGRSRASQHNHLSNLVYNLDRYAFLKR